MQKRLNVNCLWLGAALVWAGSVSAQPTTPVRFTAAIPRADFPFQSISGPAILPFEAQQAIAIYDTNDDGSINTVNGFTNVIFPFRANVSDQTFDNNGAHIGSPHVFDAPPLFTPFDGDVLVYAQRVDIIANGATRTKFIWFAFHDPARPRASLSFDSDVDFGVGSFKTDSQGVTSEVFHGAFVQDFLADRGDGTEPGFMEVNAAWTVPPAGGFGWVMSRSPDPTAALPGLIREATAGVFHLGDPAQNRFVKMVNISFDVPLIREGDWDGSTLFPATNWARTISSLNPGTPQLSAQGNLLTSSSLWTSSFGDQNNWHSTAAYYKTIRFPDLNGDGRKDVCGRGGAGIYCALSNGTGFGPVTLWSTDYSDAGGWGAYEAYWGTIQFPDVNGDHRADVCGRGFNGIICNLSNGTNGFGSTVLWTSSFRNLDGWGDNAAYWSTIRFPDLNADGRADVCGRGGAGVYCGLSIANGSAFGPVTLWSGTFSDANNWHSTPAYYGTLQFADITGDGKPDVCSRGGLGLYCARNNWPATNAFDFATLWTTQYSNAAGWNQERYYATIQLADVNGDGKADSCGRGSGGIYCGRSTGTAFVEDNVVRAASFSDAAGWNQEHSYKTIRIVDVNGDGRADACGRGNDGIYCQLARTGQTAAFDASQLWVRNFGNNNGWNSSPAYWSTVQPANVNGLPGADWCGRGGSGIWCSSR